VQQAWGVTRVSAEQVGTRIRAGKRKIKGKTKGKTLLVPW
jgi:hypothetical protein